MLGFIELGEEKRAIEKEKEARSGEKRKSR